MVETVENIKLTHHLTSMSYELQKTSRNILKKLLISKLIETSLRAIFVNGSFRRMKFHVSCSNGQLICLGITLNIIYH
jgi:hypothetical protein